MIGISMRRHLLAIVTIVLVVISAVVSWRFVMPGRAATEVPTPGIAREDFTVRFGTFQARAQLTFPEAGATPFPLVILVAGSGPADMDVTIAGRDGEVSHRLFREISDHLTRQGFATVRYNKRYVKSATDHPGDEDYVRKVTPADLQDDFEHVYARMLRHPRVDPSRIIVYGWSEGAMIATGAALAHPEIAGVILHAPPSETYKAVAHYQLLDVGVPFLREVVDADRDGEVSEAEFAASHNGEMGVALRSFSALLNETTWRGETRIRREFDRDGDGRLGIAAEVEPALAEYFLHWDDLHTEAGHWAYTTTAQPSPIMQRLPRYAGRILLLHGELDGNVSVDDSRRIAAVLAASGHGNYLLHLYPGLGHTLGPVTDRYGDTFAPIAPEVLLDVTIWLDRFTSR